MALARLGGALPRRSHEKLCQRKYMLAGMAVKKNVMKNHATGLRPIRCILRATRTHVTTYSTASAATSVH